jgi:hypothetical protein
MDAYQRGVAAILTHAQLDAIRCAGHKEYAPGRKNDPSFPMDDFRTNVAAIMGGTTPSPALIPRTEPPSQPGGAPGRDTLRRGSTGDLVREVQRKLGENADGIFGAGTEADVRAFQREHAMVPDGIIGPRTWVALDTLRAGSPAATTSLPLNTGTTPMANAPWPNTLASKVLAAYINMKFGTSPSDLMFFNPPMGALPFFNNSAGGEIRRAELTLVAGGMLKFLAEISIPFEQGSTLPQAHADLLASMVDELTPSSQMAEAINNHYRFMDEV